MFEHLKWSTLGIGLIAMGCAALGTQDETKHFYSSTTKTKNPPEYRMTNLVANLKIVSPRKSISIRGDDERSPVAAIRKKATAYWLNETGADVAVEPQFHIEFNDKGYVARMTAYAGTYSTPRAPSDEDRQILKAAESKSTGGSDAQ